MANALERPAIGRAATAAAIALLASLPVLCIAAAEIAGRLYMHVAHGQPGRSYGIYKSHPVLGGILAENAYNTQKTTNNFAFQRFDDIAAEKPAGTARVIAYGGSTVFAYNLPMGQDWPAQLERVARERGRALQVLNAGDISWSAGHIAVRAREEVDRLKPDYVLFYEGVNEEDNWEKAKAEGVDVVGRQARGEFGFANRSIVQADWLYRNSLLYKYWHQAAGPWVARTLLGEVYQSQDDAAHAAPDPLVLENYRRTVAALVDHWRERGVKVVFVIQGRAAGDSHFLRRITGYSRSGAETAAARGAIVVDSQEVVAANPDRAGALFYTTGIHWSAEGSVLLARHVFERVDAVAGWR